MEIIVDDNLTWQKPNVSNEESLQAPSATSDCMPQWWKNLPGDVTKATGCPVPKHDVLKDHGGRSAKFCLGLRGARTLGWTIPLEHDLDLGLERDHYDWIKTAELHPEMLHGSCWAEKKSEDTYEWRLLILSWPWRAKMSQGWRLLVTANPFYWSRDWHAFTGCVDANYEITRKRNINNFWSFSQEIDQNYNYYNIETVIAVKSDCRVIPKNTCLFSAIPIWDPEYQRPTYKKPPMFI